MKFFNCHHDQYQEAQHGLVKLFYSVLQTLTQRHFFPHIHCNTKLGRKGTMDLIDSPSGLGISLLLGPHFCLVCIHTSPFKPIKSYRHRFFPWQPIFRSFLCYQEIYFSLSQPALLHLLFVVLSLIPLGYKNAVEKNVFDIASSCHADLFLPQLLSYQYYFLYIFY